MRKDLTDITIIALLRMCECNKGTHSEYECDRTADYVVREKRRFWFGFSERHVCDLCVRDRSQIVRDLHVEVPV